MVRTKQFMHTEVVEPSRLPHQPMSICLNSGLAFPLENVFLCHFYLDLPSEEAHRIAQWTQSSDFSLLQTEIPQELYFSQTFWATGRRKKKKKKQDIGKNPHKVTSIIGG